MDTNSFFRGTGVALATPFTEDGNIDFKALERLVDHVIEGGVDYLVVLGTTAETPTLGKDERREVVNRVRRHNAGRLPVVVGIGGNCTATVLSTIGESDFDGVSALLSVTPYYNKPSQRGLYEHFKAVAAASPVPVILYNVPSRTGVNMLPETTLRLAREAGNIAAIKEACGDLAQFRALLDGSPEGFSVISGDDATALSLVEMGGSGVISVAANAFPAPVSEMIRAALSGDFSAARNTWDSLRETVAALFEEGNPTGVKAALHSKGIINNILRLPLVESSPELHARIERLIREYSL